ncbi:MAG TPA: hypothetical protein PK228_02555 [Saprospiraceae bacterium]|nr:hypothetical protein [Saprospiraceae bacterium]
MNKSILPSIWRFLGLVAVQGLLLHQVGSAINEYFNVLLYPLFILFLPIQISSTVAVLLGFLIGLAVDMFYASPGVHASAGAFSGFARSIILAGFKPKGGYTGKEPIPAPGYFGWPWFLQVAGVFFAAHLFWYFSVNAFSFVYFTTITAKTLAGWSLTMIFVVLFCILFNPKN